MEEIIFTGTDYHNLLRYPKIFAMFIPFPEENPGEKYIRKER